MKEHDTGINSVAPNETNTDRADFVRNEVRSTYERLLSLGGMITESGRILGTYGDVELENMELYQEDELKRKGYSRLTGYQSKNLLPPGTNSKRSKVYLLQPGLIDRLEYRMRPRRKIGEFYVKGINDEGNDFDHRIFHNMDILAALRNYASRILEAEGMIEDGFPKTRYSENILREIIDARDAERAA